MLYAVNATITTVRLNGTTSRQLPTFYLDSRVQGILDERHARKVATDILMPYRRNTTVDITIAECS